MISITVDVTEGLDDELKKIISSLTGEGLATLNTVGGRAATEAAKKYHREFERSGGWRGNRHVASSTSGRFGQNVALGWHFVSASPSETIISNNADYYAFKVRGGTITPKRAKALTIPIHPDARGRRVKDYEAFSGVNLFRIKGKSALFQADDSRGVIPIYALKKSVTQRPWKGAEPPEEIIKTAFLVGWRNALADKLS